MEFTLLGIGILTWITFLPVVGMVAVLLLPKNSKDAADSRGGKHGCT